MAFKKPLIVRLALDQFIGKLHTHGLLKIAVCLYFFVQSKLHIKRINIRYGKVCCQNEFVKKRNVLTLLSFYSEGNEGKNWRCLICKKWFKNTKYKKRHYLLVHYGKGVEKVQKKSYQCNKCSKSYSSKQHLKHHELLKHNSKLPDYATKSQCLYCDQMFSTKSNLTRHINSVHLLVTFSCDFCEKQFKHKENLTFHILSVHSYFI